jgi:hypothetical protein
VGGTRQALGRWERFRVGRDSTTQVLQCRETPVDPGKRALQVRRDTLKMQAKRYELIQPMHRLYLPTAWTPIHLDEPNEFYKVVAADAFDRLVSVYDGTTEYHMGRTHRAKRGTSQWAPMETCYFVYRTKEQVRCTSRTASGEGEGREGVFYWYSSCP